jgi:hypothetical protein
LLSKNHPTSVATKIICPLSQQGLAGWATIFLATAGIKRDIDGSYSFTSFRLYTDINDIFKTTNKVGPVWLHMSAQIRKEGD